MTDSLEALQGLYQDLLVLSEARLPALERLSLELESQLHDFRVLLDKPSKNDTSRKAIQSGTIEIDDQKYSLNDDFKLASQQLADELDLDEIHAAKLFLEAQDEAAELERSPLATAVFRFHRRRQLLLDCLRILVQESCKVNEEDDSALLAELRIGLVEVVKKVVGFHQSDADSPSRYWRKCLQSMADIEQWQQRLADQIQRYSVTGQSLSSELSEVIDFQQQSLLLQHECLATVAALLVQIGYTVPGDVTVLVGKARKLERYDRILVHYSAILITAIAHFGPGEDVCSLDDVRPINEILVSGKDADRWTMRNFHAAIVAWWLAQYSGRFQEPADGDALERARNTQLSTSLDDGAFHFTLAFIQDVTRSDWEDPARVGLVTFLLSESIVPTRDFAPPSADMQTLICTGLQSFTEAFITNMPDTIRTLSSTENDSRKTMRSRFQRGNQDSELHVERFLLLASYAYDNDSGAAMSFWAESDSNLYGFLQWAARRQTTPRVAAFCELLRSLSDDRSCADAVHRFLLDEGQPLGGRLRRTGPLSWAQILAELQFYATNPREKQSAGGTVGAGSGVQPSADEFVEPESAMMLECYLRLVSHLCKHSSIARDWLLGNPDVQFHEMLLQLCSNALESRLRACAFTTLGSLCTAKTAETAAKIWTSLDAWIYGVLPATATFTKNLARLDPAGRREHALFRGISASLEESLAFIGLLQALLAPLDPTNGLNDGLPYPEGLGSTYRMPGIDAYIDFALGLIFAEQSNRVERTTDLRLLRLSCLRLTALCLTTFNEDLVVIANRGGTGVDGVIQTSSLSAYVRLHPFARVMEWVFTEKVVRALFAAAHQDVEEINSAQADSPLVLSVLESTQVISAILRLQPTYLDIVRPLVKAQPSSSRTPVGNAALATFEDAILNNLQIVIDVGLYCGTSHQDLTVAALGLLQSISVSRKLTSSVSVSNGYKADRSKLVTILECDDDADRIARGLTAEIQFNERELEAGPDAAGHVIKKRILEFLLGCLLADRDRPTIAHSLLGFKTMRSSVTIAEGSSFSQGESLFHAIARLAIDYPDQMDGTFVSWTSTIKALCTRILQALWDFPLTSHFVLTELRNIDFIFVAAVQQPVVGLDTFWDGRLISDAEFMFSDSALAFTNFLQQRSAYLGLMARVLRSIAPNEASSLRRRLESTFLGATQFPGMDALPNASVFDLFDFMELEVMADVAPPPHGLIGDIDVDLCRSEGDKYAPANLAGVEELLLLRQADLRQKGQLASPEAQGAADAEAQDLLLYTHGSNQRGEVLAAHRTTLKAWVQLMIVTSEYCTFDEVSITAFSLQTLQLLLPKMEKSFLVDHFAAKELSALALTLVRHVDAPDQPNESATTAGLARDRLYQLFRVCMIGVGSFEIDPELRDIGYQICYRYLRKASTQPTKKSAVSHNVLHTVKTLGSRLTDVICDDAVSGQAECRVSAILLLAGLVDEGNSGSSKHLLQMFDKINFVGVLVDGIKTIPTSLNQSSAADLPLLVVYYKALFALLLRIAHTPTGASAVSNSGLFASARASLLFTIDPDIGIDMAGHQALKHFFDLSLAVLQLINAVVLTRGQQNEQTIRQAREFLTQARPSVVGVFKRNARIAAGSVNGTADVGEDLTDLVDNWTLLVSLAGFLEYEDDRSNNHSPAGVFS